MTVELALRRARVRYGPLEALHGVNLVFPSARITALLGRNGSGRTTVLRALAGTAPLSAGRVVWRGADVTGTPAQVRARRGMFLVPDRGAVFGGLTVAENLALSVRQRNAPALPGPCPALSALLPRRAATLSGGEQRMLAVARALLSPARVLLLDEPASGMSTGHAARTYALLAAATREGRTVVVAETALSAPLADVTCVVHELRRGTVAFSGEPVEPGAPR
ncbi:ATP-binding cassette domain-containing protein [Streptomyces sp. NPDC054796]